MVAARKALSDSGGKITMRRLNRREYRNTIQQLTGVKVDAGSLPADGGAGTFDTVGASLFVSSDQIEQYLKLGRSAIDEVFERQAAQKEKSRIFRVEPETTVNVQSREALSEIYQGSSQIRNGVPRAGFTAFLYERTFGSCCVAALLGLKSKDERSDSPV